MSRRFAEGTNVQASRTQQQIQEMLRRAGASQFMQGWDENAAGIGFVMHGRAVQIIIPMPARDHPDFVFTPTGKDRSDESALKSWEQATRARWRAAHLVIKAKLEAIEVGISTFEREFFSDLVLPNGKTVFQQHEEPLLRALDTGHQVKMLDFGGGA